MEDDVVIGKINELAREEHALVEKHSHGTASDGERERLARLEIMLDQCWDLLRQRRARREFGQNPDDAKVRGAGTVEKYIG